MVAEPIQRTNVSGRHGSGIQNAGKKLVQGAL
jgi:hypothetical protein